MPASQTDILPSSVKLTLADVVAQLERDRSVSEAQLKEARGAVHSVSKIVGRPPDAISASMTEVARLLAEVPRGRRRQSDKTVANIKARLKLVLVDQEARRRFPPRGAALMPEWAELAARLTDLRLRNGLSRLIRWASWRGLTPASIDNRAFEEIVLAVGAVNWGRDVGPFRKQSTACWNEAAATVAGWPQSTLDIQKDAPSKQRLAIDAFPSSFGEDLARYLAWASGEDSLADDAPARPAAPGTLRLRGDQIRLAASALAVRLGDSNRVTNLTVLVQPSNVRLILTQYLSETLDGRPTTFVNGLAATLVSIARHWVKLSEKELAELSRLRRKVSVPTVGLTEKNRHLIRQTEDPVLRHQLLNLPTTLATQGRAQRASPARRLQRMQIALAIELLLVAPMRLQNLASLRINEQLQWPTGRHGEALIVLHDDETKNGQPLEFELGEHTKSQLYEYLDQFRSRTKAPADGWLFVGMDGRRVSADALRDGITKAVHREIGISITPHQFRHLAAAILLDARPGAIGLVRDLLGHKSIKTTVSFYAGMRTREAGREYDRILSASRLKSKG